jgi:NAD(P)-dependent dehydrogenase (short-subunit alcohol dehydrogenase family)
MSNTPLNGVSALVVGGAGGFGFACAARLARDGAAVTLMGRTSETLEQAANDLRRDHPSVDVGWFAGDASNEADVAAAVAQANQAPLGICVATVGGSTVRPFLGLDEGTLRYDFDRNVVTALLAMRHAGAAMAARGGGSIVCLSSSAGGLSFPFMGSYSVAKAALEALVRVAADELGHLGVRVNAVRPGLVPTKAAKPAMLVNDPEQRATVLAEKPLARVGTVEDVAEAVRYLAGPESSWVTGAVLPVEGGNHLRRAPRLETLARSICGDAAIDQALAGAIPSPISSPIP